MIMPETALDRVRGSHTAQPVLGLLTGILFGFLLQKAGVSRYDVIIGQLLLYDFTVVKVMLSAVIAGTVLFHGLKYAGLVRSRAAPGSLGSNVIGGLIFGIGFALLGYCPGTAAAAAGSGALDAAAGGFTGLVIGSAVFAKLYPAIDARFLHRFPYPMTTLPELLGLPERFVVPLVVATGAGCLLLLEMAGF